MVGWPSNSQKLLAYFLHDFICQIVLSIILALVKSINCRIFFLCSFIVTSYKNGFVLKYVDKILSKCGNQMLRAVRLHKPLLLSTSFFSSLFGFQLYTLIRALRYGHFVVLLMKL